MTSIWGGDPSQEVVNADNSYKAQRFIATAEQTVFTLTDFSYAPATGSLLVLVSGVDQFIGTHYLETSSASITFTSPCEEGDEVVIRGLIGSTGAQSAADSAAAAEAAATEAQVILDQILNLQPPNLPLSIAEGGTGQITADAAYFALAGSKLIKTVISITDNATLLPVDLGYLSVVMSGAGKSIIFPSVVGTPVGFPRAVVDNSKCNYPVALRNISGALFGVIDAGAVLSVGLKDNAADPGDWTLVGEGQVPGITTIDTALSTSYQFGVLAPFCALDDNVSIHFAALGSGFAAFVVDNLGKVITTPTAISVAANDSPSACMKISATSAIIFYGVTSGGAPKAAVLSLTGSSGSYGISLGAVDSYVTAGANWGGENSLSSPKIAQLTPTLYVCAFTEAPKTRVIAFSVAGNVVTHGAILDITAVNSPGAEATCYPLTATTAVVLYKVGAAAPYANTAVIVSVAGVTCTIGAPVALTGCAGSGALSVPYSCLLSSTKLLVCDNNNTATTLYCNVFTITGNALAAGTAFNVEGGIGTTNLTYSESLATRYNAHLFPQSANTALLWYFDNAVGASRAVLLTENAGIITRSAITYYTLNAGSSASGAVLSLGVGDICAVKPIAGSGVVPCMVTGSQIVGSVATPTCLSIPDGFPGVVAQLKYVRNARLSRGYQVIQVGDAQNSVETPRTGLQVFKTAGTLSFRGTIRTPECFGPAAYTPIFPVSPNRVVFLTAVVSAAQASVFTLRIMNVEVVT